jgi:hypothetical protein
MNKMLTRTALVSSLVLAGASYSNAQTTVSGNLNMTYKAIKSDQSGKQQYRGFGKESQINLTNKGKLNNGMDYVAGFSIELDGSDTMQANSVAANQASNSLAGAFNENTYIDFISGNTTFTIGADHIQNPDFAVSNLVGVSDIDDLMSGVGVTKGNTSTPGTGLALLFPTNKGSAYESYGFGIIQTIPAVGKASINYVPNATTGVAANDQNAFNSRTNSPSLYDGMSRWEVGFNGDLGVKGLTASAFYNRTTEAGQANTTGQYLAAKYNTGNITVALGRAEQQANSSNAGVDTQADEAGIAYAISKDVSIGYSAARTKKDGTATNEKMQQISLGYSLGPISTGITVGSISNLGGTSGVDGDAILARAAVNF